MTTFFPATLLPCISKPQFSFPQLEIKTPNSIFTCSSSKPVHNNNNLQNPKPNVTRYSTISNEDTLLFNDWPELIKISIGSRDFLLGQAVHSYLVKAGSQDDTFKGNNVLNLYVKFNRLDLAQKVFDRMRTRNTITWTSLIKGYLEDNDFQSAFSIAGDMHKFGENFNEHTCTVILQACSSPDDRILGEQIHCFVIKSGFDENVFVGTSLIAMYTKSGFFDVAEKVFDSMGFKDIRCLNFMILEYGRAGNGGKAIEVFKNLLNDGFEPTDYTFTNIISTCNGDLGVEEGKQLQGLAFKYGFLSETSVGNAIITMYGNSGMPKEAERMFSSMSEKNLISWTALISGYSRSGYGKKAVDAFLGLHDELGINFDSTLLTAILDCCSDCNNLELGLQIHGFVMKLGCACDVNVATALVDLYAKCEKLQSARIVFDHLSNKGIASFNAILAGFLESSGDEEDPMILFNQLRLAGVKPDMVTFSRLLSLLANQASLEKGRSFHAYTVKTGFDTNISVANSVISMYAKCGSIEDAHQMFNIMNCRDSISWNALISAYALHGQAQKSLFLFEEMKRKGFDPDEFTILAILQACTYSGLWKDGICLFNLMEPKYGIKPLLEHYACMADLLGRAGYLSEAMDIIKRSPFPKSTLLWRTLVNVCKLHGNLNFGKLASKHLLDLSPVEAGSYILVSNMYASEKMSDEAAKVRKVMNDLKFRKEAGSSWIEIDNKVHHFVASDKDHPESREIYTRLELLTDEMKWS
ncbi:pentatricopeptide repeat-containing protein, putative [Ricinus communis]|uniref:Pentatricopeptide repeat-containing protein, putative n=1 Tax=Ricinus communis TaxID=3988 RepID=B9SUF3_RICCO|nr:pentatricopeptide repeat-containing protein, putative [Ricinus communis]|eukprot:XP_002529622.1 pentatricopeptide repeat-containing protein At5g27110 [Ricinus communis]